MINTDLVFTNGSDPKAFAMRLFHEVRLNDRHLQFHRDVLVRTPTGEQQLNPRILARHWPTDWTWKNGDTTMAFIEAVIASGVPLMHEFREQAALFYGDERAVLAGTNKYMEGLFFLGITRMLDTEKVIPLLLPPAHMS